MIRLNMSYRRIGVTKMHWCPKIKTLALTVEILWPDLYKLLMKIAQIFENFSSPPKKSDMFLMMLYMTKYANISNETKARFTLQTLLNLQLKTMCI